MAKNRITYAAILITVIVFVGLYDRPAVYTALYAVLLIPLFSFLPSLFLLSVRKKLDISEKLSASVVKKGEKAEYYLTVANKSRFYCRYMKAVLIKEKRGVTADCKAKIFSLPPRGSCEIGFEVAGKYRGIFNVGVSEIWFYDTLGLFRFRKKINGGATLTVLPEAVHLEGMPFPQSEFACAEYNADNRLDLPEEDCSEMSGLREHIPEDGYKRIHWKLSAKRNKLISKTYRVTSEKTIMLMVDNSRFEKNVSVADSDRCEDKLIEALVSVIAHCAGKRFNTGLCCMDGETPVSSRKFEDLYAAAANIKFNADGSSFDKFFSETANKRADMSNIIVFMRDLTDLFCESVKAILSDRNVTVFYCPDGKYADKKRRIENLRDSGAVCYILSNKTGIAEAVRNCA